MIMDDSIFTHLNYTRYIDTSFLTANNEYITILEPQELADMYGTHK